MAKPPRRPPPQKRKSDMPPADAVASRAVVPKKRDPGQAGIFDRPLPAFIRPQLAKLVTEAPEGERWAHELKFDGYRMHARVDRGRVQLITARSGLDWTSKYPATAEALNALSVARPYLDGEFCAVRPDGTTSFSLMQAATDGESAAGLVYYAFDLLHLKGRRCAVSTRRPRRVVAQNQVPQARRIRRGGLDRPRRQSIPSGSAPARLLRP
jgi:ATP-dependent DNA ligase